MAYSAYLDNLAIPDGEDVRILLGPAAERWCNLRSAILELFPNVDEDWVFSGKNHGWSLRFKLKKRAIIYFTPRKLEFRASLALGEKAVALARTGGLPPSILAAIDEAPKYPEGRGLRIVVETDEDVKNLAELAKIKMST